MSAKIIDGKAHAERLTRRIAAAVEGLRARHGLIPGLAVVLVGADPASQVYIRNKARQTVAAGMNSWEHKLPAEAAEAELEGLIDQLNRDPAVHGILVQLPLPRQIDSTGILDALSPAKDVDGFHVINAGRLVTGQDALVPCTPVGCLLLAKSALGRLDGLEAVVVGRSNIVGKPAAQLLLRENCTVTIAHSKTRDLPAVCRRADLLIAAVGRAEMVRGDWVKPGACVIDVGINRTASSNGTQRLIGDVAFAEVAEIAGSITPVPGGVGPMTIACLLRNTLIAACAQTGLPAPAI